MSAVCWEWPRGPPGHPAMDGDVNPGAIVEFTNRKSFPAGESQAREVVSVAVGVALDPVLAGNDITLNAENCPNARIAGVVFEKHFHFGSTTSSSVDETRSQDEFTNSSRSNSRCSFSSLAAHYIRQHSWICPPGSGLRYAVEDLYVGLKLKLLDRNGQARHGDARKKKILFEPFKRTNVTPRTVLVVGGPGFGKTTLCRKIAYDWAGQGKTFPEFCSDEAVVLYLDMSCLKQDALLEDELLKLAARVEGLEPEEAVIDDTKEILKSYDRNVIVVLDGYVGVSEELQVQIREMVKSKSNSVFKAASIVVTSRPGLDDQTVQLFHKHFILKGFSVGLAQKLVYKYFNHSARSIGVFFQDVLSRFEMKNLSPFVILTICQCEINFNSTLNVLEIFRSVALRISKLSNIRNCLGLTDEQVEDKLEHLGFYFWKCLWKNKHSFTNSELKEHLKSNSEFVLSSGLLVTKNGFETWEPVHQMLMESIAIYHLERKWTSCWANRNITSFLKLNFPKLSLLRVNCYTNLKNDEVSFRVTFDFYQFKMCFTITANESKFQVLNKALSLQLADDDDNKTSSISYRFLLRKKEDSEAIASNLQAIFPNEKALCNLMQFISSASFSGVSLNFVLSCNSPTQGLFTRKKMKQQDNKNANVSHPLSRLRMFCQELRVTFVKSLCVAFFIREVFACVLELHNSMKFDSEYHILESLRKVVLKPPLASAFIYGTKTIYSSGVDVCVKRESQLNTLCDRMEIIFGGHEMLEQSLDTSLLL